jgi:hypothetical protein
MEFNFFGKTKKAPKHNPFLNKPRSTDDFREKLIKEEEIVRHSIPKDMPNRLKVLYSKMNPDNPNDLREVIRHVQFPEDDYLKKVTNKKIEHGLEMGYLVTANDLKNSLDHLFTRKTIEVYSSSKDIYETRTIFWFPKPIIFGFKRYYIAQDVAHYVQFVEDLRAERIAKRELGYLVPQKVRTQPEMDNVVKKKNISKFKVGAKKVFNFFTRKKA